METWLPKLSKRGLSPANVADEKKLWENAQSYRKATLFHVDPGYNGYFFEQDLNATSQILKRAQPNYLFVDTEAFSSWEGWLTTVNQSSNAQARRLPGESDTQLALRIVSEIIERLTSTIRNASPRTEFGFFGGAATNNAGFGVFPWSVLGKAGVVSQPGFYGQHSFHNLQSYNQRLRAERLALDISGAATGSRNKMVPWLTVGRWNLGAHLTNSLL